LAQVIPSTVSSQVKRARVCKVSLGMMFCRACLVAVGVCVPTAFLGCGTDSDSGGTDSDSGGGPASSPGAFCKDESHFMPDNEIELLHHCDGVSSVPKETCEEKGCFFYMQICMCSTQAFCEGVGGTWNEVKCNDLGGKWADFINKASEARSNNNICEGKVTTFPEDGGDYTSGQRMDLRVAVGTVARACCSSFPETVCDADNTAATCKSPEDLLVNEDAYGKCLSFHAPKTTCEENNCDSDAFGCRCTTEADCKAAGSRWLKKTCGDDMRQRNDDYYAKIATARATDSCSSNGAELMFEDGLLSRPSFTFLKELKDRTYFNRKCCISSSDLCDSTVEEALV